MHLLRRVLPHPLPPTVVLQVRTSKNEPSNHRAQEKAESPSQNRPLKKKVKKILKAADRTGIYLNVFVIACHKYSVTACKCYYIILKMQLHRI